ncbi:hypothetical protein TNCV_1394881 [Trichonephila clavipes]|nr:hypothetical protein TNCV_1394881 [Trichonephila clavipes]
MDTSHFKKDFAPSKFSKVCELHFSDDAIRRYTEAYNEKTERRYVCPQSGTDYKTLLCQLFLQISPHIFLTLEIPLENVLRRECKD